MPQTAAGVASAQQFDDLYNLTQLAEVSIVYFKNHTATIVEDSKPFEKVSVSVPGAKHRVERAGNGDVPQKSSLAFDLDYTAAPCS